MSGLFWAVHRVLWPRRDSHLSLTVGSWDLTWPEQSAVVWSYISNEEVMGVQLLILQRISLKVVMDETN